MILVLISFENVEIDLGNTAKIFTRIFILMIIIFKQFSL